MAYGSLPSRLHGRSNASRSVSDPFGKAIDSSPNNLEPLPFLSLNRRTSLDYPTRQQDSSKRHQRLPSIKALRDKFTQGWKWSSHEQGKKDHEHVPTKGNSPKKLSKNGRSGVGRVKGENQSKEGEGMVKSASMPSLGLIAHEGERDKPPLPLPLPLPLRGGQMSVDALLANSNPKSPSPRSPSPTSRLPRSSSITSPQRRPQTSQNLSPTSQPLPVFNRISSDFARSAADPPLSTLRAPQIRDTVTLNKPAQAINRHSRILPGATLPTAFPSLDPQRPLSSLSRSHSVGPSISSDRRVKRSSTQSITSVHAPSVDSQRKRSSLLPTEIPRDDRRMKDDLAFRRHSLSPVIPSAANSSPEASPSKSDELKSEEERGRKLSNFLDSGKRSSLGLGIGGVPQRRRPSKPFPGGFEEVPFRAKGSASDVPTTQTSTTHPLSPNPVLIGARRNLKAISIPARQPETPSPPSQIPSHELPPITQIHSTVSLPEPLPMSPLTPAPQSSPTRKLQNSARLVTLTLKRSLEHLLPSRKSVSDESRPPQLRRSQSETSIGTILTPLLRIRETVPARQDILTAGGTRETINETAGASGSYAERLRELKALRTPILDGDEKRRSKFETVEPELDDTVRLASEERGLIGEGRSGGDDEQDDESRPVSPTHFKNSPNALHPFRLSTYLDFLSPNKISPNEEPQSVLLDAARSQSVPSPLPLPLPSPHSTSLDSSDPLSPIDRPLTLGQMEQEITKMERELALAGTPRSFFTDDSNLDLDLDSGSPIPCPPLDIRTSASQTSPLPGDDQPITPRTARKWSIVEVEKAYERMRRMLGSSSSSRIYTPSEVDGEVELEPSDPREAAETSDHKKQRDGVEVLANDGDVFSDPTSHSRKQSTPVSEKSSLFGQLSSSSPTQVLNYKPLPGIPPPTPSPRSFKQSDLSLGESETENVESLPSTRPRASSDLANHRRLVLPSRVRSKTSIDELTPLDLGSSKDSRESALTSPRSPGSISPGAGGRRSRLSGAGVMRSGAGRELQRKAQADIGDSLDRSDIPPSPTRQTGRLSIHRLVPPPESPRRREQTRSSDSSTWYPTTPNRLTATGRTRASTTDGLSSLQDRGDSRLGVLSSDDGSDTTTSTARPELAEIRKLDKLEIFFKYTAVKAELEKAEMERDALLDALRETRETLAVVRRQRDAGEVIVKEERQFATQLKEHLGGEPDLYIERFDNLLASRSAWQRRAQEALEELELARREVSEGRERQEELERENMIMKAKLSNAGGNAGTSTPSTIVPNTRIPSVISSPRNESHASPSTSPTFPDKHSPETPRSTALFRTHRNNRISTTSSAPGFEALEFGSPLMSQTIQFVSKSSNGSYDSPVKPTQPTSRIPFPTSTTSFALRRGSKMSTESSTTFASHDEFDRSFDSASSAPPLAEDLRGLKERDAAFLEDLTNEVPKETLEEQSINLSHLLS